jgi:hypothetical protein
LANNNVRRHATDVAHGRSGFVASLAHRQSSRNTRTIAAIRSDIAHALEALLTHGVGRSHIWKLVMGISTNDLG